MVVSACASSSAFLNDTASSASLRSVMSRATFDAPTTRPAASLMGEIVKEISRSVPSLRMRQVSKCSTSTPRLSRSRMIASSSRRSAGMIRVMCWPTASSAVYPSICSAALFQLVIMPSRPLLMMASSEEFTIAASKLVARSARFLSVTSCMMATKCASSATPSRVTGVIVISSV